MFRTLAIIIASIVLLIPTSTKAQTGVELALIKEAYEFFDSPLKLTGASCSYHLGPNQCRNIQRCTEIIGVMRMVANPATRGAGALEFDRYYNASRMNANCIRSLAGGNVGAALAQIDILAKAVRDFTPDRPNDIAAIATTRSSLKMRWSYAGPVSGMNCLQFLEPADPHTWNDNFLCFDRAIEARWSFAGPIGGMRCTRIDENADRAGTWTDNYLCVPNSSPHRFTWTSAGTPKAGCVKIHEPSEPPETTWNDNFLCVQ